MQRFLSREASFISNLSLQSPPGDKSMYVTEQKRTARSFLASRVNPPPGTRSRAPMECIWVVIKIMVPFWIPIIIWLFFRVPKKGP